ncbi:hypothetical protein IFM89_018555 [Coptis chinensis]|uniref:Uncharacterized protein n=1 Tax=Coptis chinensis TaxID=261450 RepID=A0A835M0I2_9MAGN|nr:hypothetical protein IFM89_018555 [Coptis chinensis]
MGTAVLHPQDCLMKNPYFRQPLICTPSKIGGGGRNRNRSPRSGGRRKRSPSDNESDRSNSSKSMVDRFSTKDLVMGQVKILKRGEKIESPPSKILNKMR